MMLPALPNGGHLTLEAPGWGRGVGTGGTVWPAAGALCRCLRDEGLDGLSVLELGTGTGAVGLFAAGCGARSVVLTDTDASLCSLAAENWRSNRDALPDGTLVTTQRYRWGEPIDALGGPFDLCVGSDVTYEPRAHGALLRTLSTLLEIDGAAPPRILLAHQHRPLTSALKREGCLEHLIEEARRRGLVVRERPAVRAGLGVVSLIEVSTAT